MGPVVPSIICFVAGAAAGAWAVFVRLHRQLAGLEAKLAHAESGQEEVAALRVQASALRHDLRGILSPALLSADRLANSQDPASRKAADIVIRSVERATQRLADKGSAQDVANSALE